MVPYGTELARALWFLRTPPLPSELGWSTRIFWLNRSFNMANKTVELANQTPKTPKPPKNRVYFPCLLNNAFQETLKSSHLLSFWQLQPSSNFHQFPTSASSNMPGPRRRSVPQGAARYWDPVPQIASVTGVLFFFYTVRLIHHRYKELLFFLEKANTPIPMPMTDPNGAGRKMLTWLGYIDGIHVTIYIAYMDPMGTMKIPPPVIKLQWLSPWKTCWSGMQSIATLESFYAHDSV